LEEVEAVICDCLAHFGPDLDMVLAIWSGDYGEVFGVEVEEEGGAFLSVKVGGDVDLPVGEGGSASHPGRNGGTNFEVIGMCNLS